MHESVFDLDLGHVAAKLKISAAGRALCTDWEPAMQVPVVESLPFLEPSFLLDAGRQVGLTEPMIQALIAFAPRVARDPALLVFFAYCRHRVLFDETLVQSWEEQWPPLDDYLGRDAGLLNVLVILSAVPLMRDTYGRLGVPEQVVRDTVFDLRRWMETDLYFQRHGVWGITPWIVRWLCKHWQGRLLHLGRLQFSFGKFAGKLRVYRHRGSGRVLALSQPGLRYCEDGTAWGTCCGDATPSWLSTFEEQAGSVIGNPVGADGLALKAPRRLGLDQWRQVLAEGDAVLNVHIPTGGPLGFEECGDSFRQALAFFPRYFPGRAFNGFATGSWLFDSRFERLLSPDSNIVRLMRELYLYPGIQGDNGQIYQRVFGWGVTAGSALPRKSSMQRAVADYLEAGNHFHGGYFFLLKDDFAWGSQVYRRSVAEGE